MLTVPGAAGLGILALSPLGDQYISHGILAALYCAVFVPLTALALGARGVMMYSPRSVLAFLIAAFALKSLANPRSGLVRLEDVHQTLGVLFLMVFLAGLFQAAFGAFRLGTLVKYIPSPVMAGFLNAASILIFVAQVDAMFGFRRHVPLLEIPAHMGSLQPMTLLVGLTTVLAMWHARRFTRSVPPPLVGLLAGTAAYYLLAGLGFGQTLGPVIGAVPTGIATPTYLASFVELVTRHDRWRLLAVVVGEALSLAVIAALDGLLTAKGLEAVTDERTDGNRVLLRLGAGNMVGACFGGIPCGVNMNTTFAAYRAGARSRAAVLASALTVLAAILVLPPVIARIPRVVIAGMLVVVSIQLVDRWTVQIIRKLLARQAEHWRRMLLDLFVIALVATAAIAFNLIVAVGIGVVMAVLSFMMRMSRSVIRRGSRGDVLHSRRTLEPRLMGILSAHGREILALELEGPLFFGTAEDLARQVDAALREGVVFLILDLKRVNEVDSTGARILLQIHERLAKAGKRLLLSHVQDDPAVAQVLNDVGVTAAVTAQHVFPDTDWALEWAEDQLILIHDTSATSAGERPFEDMDILAGLDAHECATLKSLLERRTYRAAEVVFRQGDEGRDLFVISKGTASVKLRLSGEGRDSRLATFSAGTVFGELALLDPGPRSASVQADEDLVCYVLTEEAFARLRKDHQAIAITLVTNLGRELSRRLRRANHTIFQLES